MRIVDFVVIAIACVTCSLVFSQSNSQKGMYNTLNGTYWESNRTGNNIKIAATANKTVFYLDSVEIVWDNYFINPESIASIDV